MLNQKGAKMAAISKRTNRNGQECYYIRSSSGSNTDNKRIRKSMIYTPNLGMTKKQIEKEVARQTVLFEEKLNHGFILDENIKFSDYSDLWLENSKPNLAPITYSRYVTLLVRTNLAIGHLKLSKIQSIHLKAFYRELGEITSEKTGKLLSQQTIKHYHRCISAILGTATKESLIPRNVASRTYMDAPKVPKKEPRHLNDEEARLFVEL